MTEKLITENKRLKQQIDRQAEIITAHKIRLAKAERAIEELKRRLEIASARAGR